MRIITDYLSLIGWVFTKRSFNKVCCCILSVICLVSIFGISPFAEAKDATSFNPVPIVVLAKGSVPVGTIAVWSRSQLPDGWLECNGQAVSSSYPELRALMPNVPNYQGMFLRGTGSQSVGHGKYGSVSHQSAGLGLVQGDSIRNIHGRWNTGSVGTIRAYSENDGAIHLASQWRGKHWDRHSGSSGIGAMGFNASRVVPTASENRPVNIAVKYIIKAE